MSLADDDQPGPDGDDFVAAEYVLGVLPADERRAAALRIDAESGFARLVDAWEVHLAPLAAGYASVEPPAAVKAAIDRRLFSTTDEAAAPAAGLWSSLALWRGLAAAALVALLLVLVLPLFNAPTPQARLLASLAADGSDVRYVAVYDGARGDVALSHVSGERAAGRDFELWVIEGQQAPVSMGVIPIGATIHLALPAAVQGKLTAGAVLAISVEPTGGSPTGQPTGAVVAAGDLKSI